MEYFLYRAISGLLRQFMGSGHIPIRRHGLAHVETYDVTADELTNIEREGSDVGFDFQVAQFCLTLGASFLGGILISPPPPDRPQTFTFMVVVIVVGFLLGAIFGIKWFRARGAFSATIRRIRERQVGPVGEEGKELRPSELAGLPATQPNLEGQGG